jgi:hypothetical protein
MLISKLRSLLRKLQAKAMETPPSMAAKAGFLGKKTDFL